MKLNLNQLTKDVATYMGESLLLDCESAESPFPDLQLRVSLLAPSLLAEILQNQTQVPREMLKTFNGSLSVDSDGIGTYILPDDFLKLVSVQVSSWKLQVVCRVPSAECQVIRLRSKWAGIRGTSLDPIVAECYDSSGKLCLKLSPCQQTGETVSGQYLPRSDSDNFESLSIPPLLYLELIEKISSNL